MLIRCSTVEFLPDYDYTEEYSGYSKSNWKEVEIFIDRPKKPFRILGNVVIRNFEGSLTSEKYSAELKKELFRLKLDGIWIANGKVMEVDPILIRTENSQGVPVAFYPAAREMGKVSGYGFRYKR
ncbi:MAG: hypothetical protein K8R21_09500 [Leptospira sp.]|nr:hypothetical protein [Leptospira sp.]